MDASKLALDQLGDFVIFRCPQCQSGLKAPAQMVGSSRACPVCRSAISIPKEDKRKEILQEIMEAQKDAPKNKAGETQ